MRTICRTLEALTRGGVGLACSRGWYMARKEPRGALAGFERLEEAIAWLNE